jgi:Pyridoxamine 5'-phosphate oxidase
MMCHLMTVHWSDEVDEILDGDHVVMLAYATPAKGAVLLPVNNFALRDRDAGTVSAVNSSVGVWRKLERIRRDPHVALAFHTREHGLSRRPEYVLVQGRASLGPPVPDYPATILRNWERFEPWSELHPLWRRWRRVYALRVAIELAVERIVVWPDLACRGTPIVQGAPLPAEPPAPQRPPRRGTGPRIDHLRAASRAHRLPHLLLGWIGADGFPVSVPAEVAGTDERGIALELPGGLVPPGGRRAGMTAHWFSRYVIGQNLRKHTGWLEAEGEARRVAYAPHTDGGYRFPASRTVFQLVSGAGTRWGARGARRAGFMP